MDVTFSLYSGHFSGMLIFYLFDFLSTAEEDEDEPGTS